MHILPNNVLMHFISKRHTKYIKDKAICSQKRYIQDKKIKKKKQKKNTHLAAEKSGGTTDRVTADQRYNGARCTEAWLYVGVEHSGMCLWEMAWNIANYYHITR